jgi:hypothetical protein
MTTVPFHRAYRRLCEDIDMKKVVLAISMIWCFALLGVVHAQAPAPDTQPAPAAPPRRRAGPPQRQRRWASLTLI